MALDVPPMTSASLKETILESYAKTETLGLMEDTTDVTTGRVKALEKALSKAMKAPVEITIRGPKKFTLSTENVTKDLSAKVKKYFGASVMFDMAQQDDDEVGSFVYFTIK